MIHIEEDAATEDVANEFADAFDESGAAEATCELARVAEVRGAARAAGQRNGWKVRTCCVRDGNHAQVCAWVDDDHVTDDTVQRWEDNRRRLLDEAAWGHESSYATAG